MFFLLLSLIHEEYSSGRIDYSGYWENIVLLAKDYERLKAGLENKESGYAKVA